MNATPFRRTSQPRHGRCVPYIGETCGTQAVPEVSFVGVRNGALTPTCTCTSMVVGFGCWAEAVVGTATIAAITTEGRSGDPLMSTNDDAPAEQHRLTVRDVVVAGFRY